MSAPVDKTIAISVITEPSIATLSPAQGDKQLGGDKIARNRAEFDPAAPCCASQAGSASAFRPAMPSPG
jgi:hypothetical protein